MSRQLIILAIFSLVLVSQGCASQEGARRYVDFNLMDQSITLVCRPDIQGELGLSQEQVAGIDALTRKPMRDIPAIAALSAQFNAATQPERMRLNNEMSKQYDEYLRHALSGILSDAQAVRLTQICWQVDGLKALDTDESLRNAIKLTNEQRADVHDVMVFYEPILSPLYRRLGRQMIAGLSGDETMKTRETQVENLAQAIEAIEKDRDSRLDFILSPEQRGIWTNITGKPLRLKWDISPRS